MCFLAGCLILHTTSSIYFAETGRYSLPKFLFRVKFSFRFTERVTMYTAHIRFLLEKYKGQKSAKNWFQRLYGVYIQVLSPQTALIFWFGVGP